jgi:hypothetical protein
LGEFCSPTVPRVEPFRFASDSSAVFKSVVGLREECFEESVDVRAFGDAPKDAVGRVIPPSVFAWDGEREAAKAFRAWVRARRGFEGSKLLVELTTGECRASKEPAEFERGT